MLLSLAVLASCGGSYQARRISTPDEKLGLADELFERKKFEAAIIEYRDFLAAFAGDERGDYAQFMIAECYRMAEEYALAGVEYRILINDYGYSEYVDDAFFLEGLSAFMMAPRAERDQTYTYEALTKIRRFLQLFPNSPRRAEALRVLEEIHDVLGRKAWLNANLYFKRKHYGAAAVYFEKTIRDFPATVWAARSWYYLGAIRERRGELAAASEAFSAAVTAQHEYPEKRRAAARLRELSKEMSGG